VHAQALSEWRLPNRRAGRNALGVGGHARWTSATARIDQVCQHLATIPASDTTSWSTAAHYAAGIFASLSTRMEAVPGPLAGAADALARSAQTRPGQPGHTRYRGLAALQYAARAAGQANRRRPDPWIKLLYALIRLVDLIADQHLADQQHRHATRLRTIAHQHLAALTQITAATRTTLDFPSATRPAPTPNSRPAASQTISRDRKRPPTRRHQ
jgi:hypothetical protein